jgi:sulfate transport system ATP-binding protein
MSITLENVTKRFGSGQVVVDRVSLDVQTGELFVLLGASGSGKSTILRMLAGLTPPDEGAIRFADRDVTRVSPQKRDVGLVFQNYSIFRHMTVGENIEFGLRIRSPPPSARAARGLLEAGRPRRLAARYDSQLSGGQRLRVALAAALAYRPAVLLLDEPFGALDVKIRMQLRQNLKEIQKNLGVTTVLVTHDQEEAFELGQRIGVMERGRLLEISTPEQLYSHPRSCSCDFLGAARPRRRCRDHQVTLGEPGPSVPATSRTMRATVRVLIRPEQVGDGRAAAAGPRYSGGARRSRGLLGRHAPRVRLRRCRACARPSHPCRLERRTRCSTPSHRRMIRPRRRALGDARGLASSGSRPPPLVCDEGRASRPRSGSRSPSSTRWMGSDPVLGVAPITTAGRPSQALTGAPRPPGSTSPRSACGAATSPSRSRSRSTRPCTPSSSSAPAIPIRVPRCAARTSPTSCSRGSRRPCCSCAGARGGSSGS